MNNLKAWLSRNTIGISVTLLIAVILFVIVMMTQNQDIDPKSLESIEREKISQLVPPGSKLVQDEHEDAQECGPLKLCGMAGGTTTQPSMIIRVFKPESSNEQQIIAYICKQAIKQGWKKDGEFNKNGCTLSKETKEFYNTLEVGPGKKIDDAIWDNKAIETMPTNHKAQPYPTLLIVGR